MPILGQIYREAMQPLLIGFISAVPDILSGLVFLIVAYPTVKLVLWGVRRGLRTSGRKEVVVHLGALVSSIFLWFGVTLIFLNLIGMEGIATSLGTATGFIGLGVALALKGMIADTVAGVHLLKDPDFMVGDRVKTGDTEGRVAEIDLRKTRIELDNGNLVVLANEEVEKKWTRLNEDSKSQEQQNSE